MERRKVLRSFNDMMIQDPVVRARVKKVVESLLGGG
jgi:hypothetical protein